MLLNVSVALIVVSIFATTVWMIAKKENRALAEHIEKISQENLDRLKNTDYHRYDKKPEYIVALGIIVDVKTKSAGKVKLAIIYYNNIWQRYLCETAVIDVSLYEERLMKNGDFVQVILRLKENIFSVKGVV